MRKEGKKKQIKKDLKSLKTIKCLAFDEVSQEYV